jgi:hypothetical protein
MRSGVSPDLTTWFLAAMLAGEIAESEDCNKGAEKKSPTVEASGMKRRATWG